MAEPNNHLGNNPDNNLDRLLDAATHSIGNEPNDEGSFGDFVDSDQDAVNRETGDIATGDAADARGNRDVSVDDDTPVQEERSTDDLGLDGNQR